MKEDLEKGARADGAEVERALVRAAKIGVFKELHKRGLLNDSELERLILKQDRVMGGEL